MRLDKYLADAAIGARQEVKKIIKSGIVAVDGGVIRDAGFHVSETAEVTVNGEAVVYHEHLYFMLNKPSGYVTANDDPTQPTVLDLFPERLRHRIFAVGRLDKDTTGLLLLTDDGAFAHRLTSPRKQIEKVYELQTDISLTEADAATLISGVTLRDGTTFRPARLVINEANPTHATITITEGKYHEVKRLLQYCGKTVTQLKRISIGSLSLDPDLAEGDYCELTEEELARLTV